MGRRRSLSELRRQLEADRDHTGDAVYARRLAEATAISRQRSQRVAVEVASLERWLVAGFSDVPVVSRGGKWWRRPKSGAADDEATHDAATTARRNLRAIPTADGVPAEFSLDVDEASGLLVVDYRLPSLDVVPHASSYKVDKATADVMPVKRATTDRNRLYQSLVAQVALRCLRALFATEESRGAETIVFNGFVESVDIASGHMTQACLVSVRLSRSQFFALHLENVDPVACLRALHAAVSPRPSELVAVQPITRLEMTDARFVTEQDILSDLESRPNLLELTPSEFESLITNLFTCMGLETRLTQASRDGGVDCVAFDLRPVLGGKVVIQAKRYANTVGVAAVRDLYGTVLNEGASKGILVTTSGYGPAAFEFANGKPLELLSGANLLALLKEWAGIDALIVPIPPPPLQADSPVFVTDGDYEERNDGESCNQGGLGHTDFTAATSTPRQE